MTQNAGQCTALRFVLAVEYSFVAPQQTVETTEMLANDTPQQTLFGLDEVRVMLGLSRRTVERFAQDGRLPPPVRVGKLLKWRRADLDAWVASLPADGWPPTSTPRATASSNDKAA